VRKHNDYTFIGWMSKDSSAFSAASILTSDTVIYANWKQLQFNITFKDGLNGDSLIKGASNGNFKLPVRKHNDYTFIGWKNKAVTFTKDNILHQRHHSDCCLETAAVQHHVKRHIQDRLVIKGASNGKFTLPVRSHNDYTFIGWKNKDGSNLHKGQHSHQRHHVWYAVWKQLQFDITLKDTFKTDSVHQGCQQRKVLAASAQP
jgi:hypothetical protein